MKVKLAPWQYLGLNNSFDFFAMLCGVGSGKTYTGAHFVIKNIKEHPECTGLIAANNYDQLSQATLRELFYWLDEYGFEYVVDQRPPKSWGARRQFKKYTNIISVRYHRHVVPIFTRVLSDPDSLRGFEISWFWLDETRDTKEYAFDVLLGRMRETTLQKGLVTTTPNGQDWIFRRFVRSTTSHYGSLHVRTLDAVKQGILTEKYYQMLRASYSPLMAAQELDAQHVNVFGGTAYYSFSDKNARRIAPWGDAFPQQDRALIVGCDFNFSPAPCVWMVGQRGPNTSDNYGGLWSDHVHWFGEIVLSGTDVSSPGMALKLIGQYPDFVYKIYGDASGNRGTTSNAGETDYNQIADTLSGSGCVFTIDSDQANPRVKDRVENMCRMGLNALGQTHMTYNPDTCPLFDSDMKNVGWKKENRVGLGKLDDGGDVQRTHASDAAGYATWKEFPPGRIVEIIPTIPSAIRSEYGL